MSPGLMRDKAEGLTDEAYFPYPIVSLKYLSGLKTKNHWFKN